MNKFQEVSNLLNHKNLDVRNLLTMNQMGPMKPRIPKNPPP